MKKCLSVALVFASLLMFAQQSVNFENSTFKEILSKAKKEKKLVFLDAFAAWCGPCKLMEKNIFPRENVKNYYNENFINARFDMEKGEGREIAAKYGIRSYPTFLYLNGDGEVVHKTFGYMEEEDFLAAAKQANNPENRTSSVKERFDNGEKDPDFLINMMRLYAETDYALAKKASERYFSNRTQALTRDDVGLLLYFIKSAEDPNFKVFTNRKPEIIQFLPENIYSQFESNIKLSGIMESALDTKTQLIKDDYFMQKAVPIVGVEEATTVLNRLKVNYYPSVGKYNEYEKAALAYYTKSENFTPEELLKAAWIFSENVSTTSSLKKAQEWAEKSVMRSETAENTYILAKLYQKTGNKESAKMYGELSRNLANQQGKDSTLATQLLESLK